MSKLEVLEITLEREREAAQRLADDLVRAEFRIESLKMESARLAAENDRLHEMYLRENKKVQRLERQLEDNEHIKQARTELAGTKKDFRETLKELKSELEYLRSIFPLKALLSAKSAELSNMEESLSRLPARHPDRDHIEEIVRMHRAEQEELSVLLAHAEEAFTEQSAKIQGELDRVTSQPPPFPPKMRRAG